MITGVVTGRNKFPHTFGILLLFQQARTLYLKFNFIRTLKAITIKGIVSPQHKTVRSPYPLIQRRCKCSTYPYAHRLPLLYMLSLSS